MIIILFTIFWLIGLGITSFTFIPVLIILAFGIPTTKRLESLKVLKLDNGIIKRYFLSLIILGTVFLATIIITYLVFPNGLIGLLFGGGMVFLFGIGQIGRNEKNISDYVEGNKKYFLATAEEIRYTILDWK